MLETAAKATATTESASTAGAASSTEGGSSGGGSSGGGSAAQEPPFLLASEGCNCPGTALGGDHDALRWLRTERWQRFPRPREPALAVPIADSSPCPPPPHIAS